MAYTMTRWSFVLKTRVPVLPTVYIAQSNLVRRPTVVSQQIRKLIIRKFLVSGPSLLYRNLLVWNFDNTNHTRDTFLGFNDLRASKTILSNNILFRVGGDQAHAFEYFVHESA